MIFNAGKEILMKLKKILAAAGMTICAAICATALSGCNVKFGTNPTTDPKLVVAKPTRLCFTDELNITFNDFNKQYLFYLNSSGVEENSSNSEKCEQLRDTIIHNIIYDKVMMLKAKEFGCDVLTEEEEKEVKEEFDNEIKSQIEMFGDKADYSDLPQGTTPTDAVKLERGEKEFNKLLENCSLTREDIYGWIKNYRISQKMVDYFKTNKVQRKEAEDIYKDYVDDIKEIYEKSVSDYEKGDYSTFWAPEGSRRIKHVLLGFDDETTAAIKKYREEKNDEAANALRTQKAAELAEKQAEVEKAIDNGDKWEDILIKYSADATGSSMYPDGYLVIPNGTSYVKEFQEAAFVPEKVGDITTCVSDYGLHIMVYAKSGEVSEENQNDIIEYLHFNLAQNSFSEQMNKWVDEYAFEIDYKAIRVEEEENSSN